MDSQGRGRGISKGVLRGQLDSSWFHKWPDGVFSSWFREKLLQSLEVILIMSNLFLKNEILYLHWRCRERCVCL